MKKIIKTFLVLSVAIGFLPQTQNVTASSTSSASEPYPGSTVCVPGTEEAGDCLAYGPSATVQKWKEIGLTYPLKGLPAYAPDPAYTVMPYKYAKINANEKKEVRVFASLENAISADNETDTIPAGALRYIAYVNRADVDGNHYLQMPDTFEWVRASPSESSTFQGLIFRETPQTNFGWIFEKVYSRTAPDYNAPSTGIQYLQNDVVQVFATSGDGENQWAMVSPGEWIEGRNVKTVRVNPNPPEGITGDRWIEVNLYDQTLAVYDQRQLLFATIIASGLDPFFTRPGVFQIQEKKDTEFMGGSFEADRSDYYYLQHVPWTMYFDGARALHAAYWRARFGMAQSHGCVNLSPGDAHLIYSWANVGDWVYVWDPSGKTPTDPAKYTQGGA